MLRILQTRAPAATVLVRLLAGAVFLSEGIQKFLFPVQLGAGRFAKIGIPAVHIIVWSARNRIPILLGRGFWIFSLPKTSSYGFWAMRHDARIDRAMLLASLFLLIVGAGPWSFDAKLSQSASAAG
jgi:putative oxidoreductase